jgi:putative acetyltransferase
MHLREVRAEDTQAVIALIGGIYRDYGFEICLDDAEADLMDIPGNFPAGSFMVLCDEDDGIHATVAMTRDGERAEVAWMKRLYLSPTLQGSGAAQQLLAWAVERAEYLGCSRIELWSDVEFKRAHRFYTKHGFVHDGQIRHMTDSYKPYSELFFFKELTL